MKYLTEFVDATLVVAVIAAAGADQLGRRLVRMVRHGR